MPSSSKTAPAPAVDHRQLANAIRALAMDAVEAAKSGHPGMPMGMADVAATLFADVLCFDASAPDWPNRDRFILSAGHGSMLLYALLYLTGFPGITIENLKRFRQMGSPCAGHPEFGHLPGIETTTGPLGQGLATAAGMAIAERMMAQRTGGLIGHHTFVIAGDGCLMEGISHEAISLAGHMGLGRLIVLFDDNSITIDGATMLSTSDDTVLRFEAAGWHAARVDGHDPAAIRAAISAAKHETAKPSLIACKTIIGFGAPTKAGTAAVHGEALGAAEIAGAREKLGWTAPPFVIPAPILTAWRAIGAKHHAERLAWEKKRAAAGASAAALNDPLGKTPAAGLAEALTRAKTTFAGDTNKRATRVWSQLTIEAVLPALPGLIGGSADLTGSNGTKTKHHHSITRETFAGNYIHYGVREFGMAAAMNGIALYGGYIPYGGTFLVFSDYARPAIRLSALMRQRVIYVMTHDSIGLGEDGPTHQPVEHLAALRAMPNLLVLRPADGVETAECWEIALTAKDTPSILALSRQAVPKLREAGGENRSVRGAYVLLEPKARRAVTLIATGTEVGLAVEAAAALDTAGLPAAVVSMPSFELFRAQDHAYREQVLGAVPRIGIEAAVAQGWHEWLRPADRFIGLTSFGASAPIGALYEHFGITVAKIVEAARSLS